MAKNAYELKNYAAVDYSLGICTRLLPTVPLGGGVEL
jgi:hypothetical protein